MIMMTMMAGGGESLLEWCEMFAVAQSSDHCKANSYMCIGGVRLAGERPARGRGWLGKW